MVRNEVIGIVQWVKGRRKQGPKREGWQGPGASGGDHGSLSRGLLG